MTFACSPDSQARGDATEYDSLRQFQDSPVVLFVPGGRFVGYRTANEPSFTAALAGTVCAQGSPLHLAVPVGFSVDTRRPRPPEGERGRIADDAALWDAL